MVSSKLPVTIFREYDIRGKVGQELFLDQMYDLGCAIAYFLTMRDPQLKTVAIGIDGRIHSPQIKADVTRALQDSGLNVVFIGLCHSPALYFAMHTVGYDAGLMITASHNPKDYNGIKMLLGTSNIYGKDLQELYVCYQQGKSINSATQGSYSEQPIIPSYVDWLADHFAHLKDMQLPVVVDCGNGAAGAVMPLLIEKMCWQSVTLLCADVDGTYPNHEADPVKLENMQDVQRMMQQGTFALGIGFDGDADRMVPMTKKGVLVPGDLLLGIFAQPVIEQHPHTAVVFDIKSSMLLVERLKQIGAVPVMSPSGHSLVKQAMKKHHALLAGELSCHFFFHDRYFGYDDGVYAMLRVCEIVYKGKDLDTLLEVYPHMYSSPEYRIACAEDKKRLVVQTVSDIFAQRKDVTLITIDGVRAQMAYGWGLLRASNTQPMLSLRFESQTEQGLHEIKQEFIHALAPFYSGQQLSDIFSKG